MFKILLVTLRNTLMVIFASIFFKNPRSYIDKAIHSWATRVLQIVKAKLKIYNLHYLEFITGRPYIIMSNHASHFDIPIIYDTFLQESIGMIAKKELFRIPFFGWAMKAGGCVSIDRENRRQALKDLTYAKKNMLAGYRIWIAPEGTRSRSGKLGVFKKGGFKIALTTKAIIIPIAIIGSNKILPPKTFNFSVNEEVNAYIGKPIDTINYQRRDIKRLIADVESEIAGFLQ